MCEFPVHRVDQSSAEALERRGTKPKFWFRDGRRRMLFKEEVRGTGEDWAELVACHLCELLGVPHVEYELAVVTGTEPERHGVVCESMVTARETLVLGNELLFQEDESYPKAKRRKVGQHTIEAVSAVVRRLAFPAGRYMPRAPDGLETALDVFVGYVLLDAWIANQDRHHQNWGAIAGGSEFRLAPTFDHGAALARNLQDRERENRMSTKDAGYSVASFARKGCSAVFPATGDKKPLGLLEAFQAFADEAPGGAKAWLGRLKTLDEQSLRSILEKVPAHRMTDVSKRFTLELLFENQKRLLT